MTDPNRLEKIVRHAPMGLAAATPDTDVKIDATKYFYLKCGVDKEDPLIGLYGSVYSDAQKAMSQGGSLDNTQLGDVITHYGDKKYREEAVKQATLGEIIESAKCLGYTVPSDIKSALAPYMGTAYSNILNAIKAGKEAVKKINEAGGQTAFIGRMNELEPLLFAIAQAKKYAPVEAAIEQIEKVKLKGRVQTKVLETMAGYYLKDLAKEIH
jgi:hypothetical protein